jgi:hypothetical protein
MVGAAVTGVPGHQFAMASGVNAALRQVGGAIGVAVMLAITADATPLTLNDLAHDGFYVAVVALFAGGVIALGMGSLKQVAMPASSPDPGDAAGSAERDGAAPAERQSVGGAVSGA